MKSINKRNTPNECDLTKRDFAGKREFFRSIFPNLKRDLAVIAGSVILAGVAIGFSYSLIKPQEEPSLSCEECIEQLDQMPKMGYIVPKRATLYGICELLGVPEECLSSCSRYIAEMNKMNPDNPQLKAGDLIGIPRRYLRK